MGSRAQGLLESDRAAQLQSYLFTVRLWSEVLGDGQMEWRGQVLDITTGEKCYLREWSTLVAFLERKLSEFQK